MDASPTIDRVDQYIGHTAPKTKEVLKRALGGTLFIDEADYLYRPGNERDHGQEPRCRRTSRIGSRDGISRMPGRCATRSTAADITASQVFARGAATEDR